jgi:hypothetical protein
MVGPVDCRIDLGKLGPNRDRVFVVEDETLRVAQAVRRSFMLGTG